MKARKIFYVQQFFNEVDLLKIKLHTIYPVVDCIILSESTHTHSGLWKEPILDGLFKSGQLDQFRDKLVIQYVDDTPSQYTNLHLDKNKDKWYNHVVNKINSQKHWDKNQESYGRDSWEKEILIRPLALQNPNDDDIVIFSDLDEIIRPVYITSLREHMPLNSLLRFGCGFYYYALNLLSSEKWTSPIAANYRTFVENSFCELRNFAQGLFVNNAGWHFSYLGNPYMIETKLRSFGEQSLNTNKVRSNLPNVIVDALTKGKDLYGRSKKFEIVPVNYDTMPAYIVEHQEELAQYLLPY